VLSHFISSQDCVVECLARANLLPDLMSVTADQLLRLGIDPILSQTEIDCLQFPDLRVPTIPSEINERSGIVRLVASENFPTVPLIIGLDQRFPRQWQLSCFVRDCSPRHIFDCLLRLFLDPAFSGWLSERHQPNNIGKVRQQTINNRVKYDLPRPNEYFHGRILWVDANSHIESLLDPYGLSILNNLSRSLGFFGIIVSPYYEFKSPAEGLSALIESFRPDLIGVSVRNIDDALTVRTLAGDTSSVDTKYYLNSAKLLIDQIRQLTSVPLIVGGAALSQDPQSVLRVLGVEHGISGRGVEVLTELLSRWRPALESVEANTFNAIWKSLPDVKDSLSRSAPNVTAQMRKLPPRNPTRLWLERRLSASTAIEGSFGCPLQCTYCLESTPGKPVRRQPPAHIVDEFEWLLNEYGVCDFHLTDSEINLPFARLKALAEEILRRDLGQRISWSAYATPHPFDTDQLGMLSASGLKLLKFSADHFHSSQLASLGKHYTDSQVIKLLDAFCNAKCVNASVGLLFGAPGETNETIDFAIRQMKYFAARGIIFYYSAGVRIYPGTSLYMDWRNGSLNSEFCYGPGKVDDCRSPMVYCEPYAPRQLARLIARRCDGSVGIRRLATYRDAPNDDLLRMAYVALAMWHRGDLDGCLELMYESFGNSGSVRKVIEKAIRFERFSRKARHEVFGELIGKSVRVG
jgi:radical SAM superfamily enzyme YgiQ (UPF0313 family)